MVCGLPGEGNAKLYVLCDPFLLNQIYRGQQHLLGNKLYYLNYLFSIYKSRVLQPFVPSVLSLRVPQNTHALNIVQNIVHRIIVPTHIQVQD